MIPLPYNVKLFRCSPLDPDDLPHIFERYYRAKHASKRNNTGSGLGLSIARLIAEAYFGSITVETESGKGSCFHVWLPTSIPEGEYCEVNE
jgi:signal transduction histidine kinase